MKRLYWRPRAVSRTALILIGFFSLGGLTAVELFKVETRQPYYEEKFAAATLSRKAMETIRDEKFDRGQTIDWEVDPAETGMIGELITPVTSISGNLSSKQTSTNPNFAAVVVDMLKRAGVRSGDTVAVGYSGSFPALNVSVCAAVDTLQLRVLPIASAAASQWGANQPDLLWIDMERLLHEKELISFRSIGCSIGGYEDLGLGMSDEARQLVVDAIKRNELKQLTASTFADAIDERMALYREAALGRPIKAYINVGGGTISVGRSLGKKLYHPGLNLHAPKRALRVDSVMTRFMREGTPVIHLVNIEEIADEYGLPIAPTEIPVIGGAVFEEREYSFGLTAMVLLGIFALLWAFVLSDVGLRIIKGAGRQREHPVPEAAA